MQHPVTITLSRAPGRNTTIDHPHEGAPHAGRDACHAAMRRPRAIALRSRNALTRLRRGTL